MTGLRNSRSGPRTRSSPSHTVDLPTLLPPTSSVWPAKSTMPSATPRKFAILSRLTLHGTLPNLGCLLPEGYDPQAGTTSAVPIYPKGGRPSPWPALKSPAHPLLRGMPPQRPRAGASYILVGTNAPIANQCRNDGRHRPPGFALTHSTCSLRSIAGSVRPAYLFRRTLLTTPLSRSSLNVGQFGAVARMSTAAPFPRRSSSRPLA